MAVDFTPMYEYAAVFTFFYFFLTQLIKMAIHKTNMPKKLPKMADPFYKDNGYTYDYVMVFQVYDEDDKDTLNEFQRKYSMKSVVDRIQSAGMESRSFYSCQRDEVYLKIRCSPKRLKDEAERINYKLLLDKERLRIRVNAGGKTSAWKGFNIIDEKRVSPYDPYEYIYGRYTSNPEQQALYSLYFIGDKKHIFRGVDRIKLILSIIEATPNDQPPGCDITLQDLQHHKCVLASFPIHEYDELKKLTLAWLTLWSWPWNQPIEKVKDYYGERIGFYFLFLQHYCTLLMWPALLGSITYIVQVLGGGPENILMPFFTVGMVVWSTFFVELWRRRQGEKAMMWGVVGYEEEEQDRPQFDGEEIMSPIDGVPMKYFASAEKAYRSRVANAVTTVAVMIVVAVVAGVFFLQVFMNSPAMIEIFTVAGFNTSSIITSILSAIVINILNMVYGVVSLGLNNYENHRTDTEYEDNLISKVFIFQLVNGFAALTYVSFIKSFIGIPCVHNNCIGDAAASLSTIFIVRLVTSAVVNVFVRKFLQGKKEDSETGGLEPGVVPTPIEEQYILDEYPVLLGTLQDYAALIIQYGYTVLFVGACPIAPMLSFVSSYIQIRIDGWKLCQAHRRPQPRTAEDMGVWQDMIEIISFLSVVYNFALVFFTSHYLVNLAWEYRWIMFICVEHTMFVLKGVLSSIVEDVPEEVQMQLSRQDFLCSKVIDNLPDSIEEEYKASSKKTNIIIADSDYDWDDPEGAADKDNDDDVADEIPEESKAI